jgi:hypothetical protein
MISSHAETEFTICNGIGTSTYFPPIPTNQRCLSMGLALLGVGVLERGCDWGRVGVDCLVADRDVGVD